MVVLQISMFCPWNHGRRSSHYKNPIVIFKQFTQESCRSYANIIPHWLHFFLEIYNLNVPVHNLTECNVLTLSIAEGYLYLKLWLSHNWISQIRYNKSWVITCCILIILSFLWKPITYEIIIDPYLGVTVTREDIYAHIVSYLQVAPYPLDSLIMWFYWVLG